MAQKLSIRLHNRYPTFHLAEINAHALFSKWFSESGKIVNKLFAFLRKIVQEKSVFLVLLIDEVESLSASRKASMAGSEPADAIRVVNALLTEIDRLRQRENVLIMATSNITEAIDAAFLDRCDIRQFIGPPSFYARFQMIQSCLEELMRVGIISPQVRLNSTPLTTNSCKLSSATKSTVSLKSLALISEESDPDALLEHAAIISEGLSGRSLKKLPLQAHATYVGQSSVSCPQLLKAMIHVLVTSLDRDQ